jgi:hypothetical protein
MLICQAAQHSLPSQAKQIFAANECFLLLGAVSPDLPAVSDKVHGTDWSDRMHDGRLTRLVVPIFQELKAAQCRDARLAWLFGYVGHIVADVVVHPVVRLSLKHPGRDGQHQRSEIITDTLLFNAIKTWPLKSADFLGWLKECNDDQNRTMYLQTMATWSACLKQADPSFEPSGGSCSDWYAWYVNGVEAATEIPRWVFGYNYLYPKVSQIDAADRRDFYDDVTLPLPAGAHGPYRPNVFDLAVTRLSSLWQQMWTRLLAADSGGIDDLIPDWNLNDGSNRTPGKQRDLDLWVAA